VIASRRISLAVGAFGVLLGALHCDWASKVAPDDENPLGMLFAGCAMFASLPAFGLLFAFARNPTERRSWKIWLALSVPAALLLALLAAFSSLALHSR
jgi:hypothetical protein